MLDLSDDDKNRLRLSWSKVMASPEVSADLFYGRLFEAHPETRKLFKGEMVSQGKKLVDTINTVVDNLDADLSETVLGLGKRHQQYDVVAEDYAKVGAALIWMLETILGNEFDHQTHDAWGKAYGQLSEMMLRGYA